MKDIIYLEKPVLRDPHLVLGFEGWPNAAEVSSFAVDHLIDKLGAKQFASIPYEKFNPLSLSRPVATIKGGKVTDLTFSGNHFHYAETSSSHDIILFRGTEPTFEWEGFCDSLLGLAEMFRVSQIFTIGGTYDYVPHTVPPIVSAVFNHDDLREKLVKAGLSLTEYTGPISIHTFLLTAATRRGMEGVGLWGHAPQYLQGRNLKVVCAVLKGLSELTGLEVDLADLEKASEYFDEQVKQLVEDDPKMQEVIHRLEEIYHASDRVPPLSRKREESKKEERVITIRGFLKKREDEGKKES